MESGAVNPAHQPKVHTGVLRDHGAAPHWHIRGNNMSYYLAVETSRGTEVLWNGALHGALHRSRAQRGDQVTVIDKGPLRPTPAGGAHTRNRGREGPADRWLITREHSGPEEASTFSEGKGWRGTPQRVGALLKVLASRIATRVLPQDEDRKRFLTIISAATSPETQRTQSPSSPGGATQYVEEQLQARVVHLRQHPLLPRFDEVHLRDIHAVLFRGLTVDGGNFRSAGIAAELEALGAAVKRQGYFAGLPPEDFSRESAALFRDVLKRRPFEYGNTPAVMVLIEQLARVAGHSLHLFGQDRPELNAALRDALTLGDVKSLERTILDRIKVAPARTGSREAAERGNVRSDLIRAPNRTSQNNAREGAARNRPVPAPVSRDRSRTTEVAIGNSAGRTAQPRNLLNYVR